MSTRPVLRAWLVCALLAVGLPTRAEDIDSVLARSQAQRLAQLSATPGAPERAAIIQRSFDQVLLSLMPAQAVQLRVVQGAVLAETLQGRVVVANERLADLPEAERCFVLAHEIGHALLGHWSKMGVLYKQHVPGEVVPEVTDAVAGRLGRDASQLSHQQEFEADAFGQDVLARLGFAPEAVPSFFLRMGVVQDTATHPGTAKRLMHLRSRL